MALIFETEKYRHKENEDFIITVLQINAVDEDYQEPVVIYQIEELRDMGWQMALNENFLYDFVKLEEE